MLGDETGLRFTERQRRNLVRLRVVAVLVSIPPVLFWLSMSYYAYLITHAFEEWSRPSRIAGDVWFLAILLATTTFLTPVAVAIHWITGPGIRTAFVVTLISVGLVAAVASTFGGDAFLFRSYVHSPPFDEIRAMAVRQMGSDTALVHAAGAAWASGVLSIIGATAALILSAGKDYGERTAHAREVRSLAPYG